MCCRTVEDDYDATFVKVVRACRFWHSKPLKGFNMHGNWIKHDQKKKHKDQQKDRQKASKSAGSHDKDDNEKDESGKVEA